jgi:hypothetical protein
LWVTPSPHAAAIVLTNVEPAELGGWTRRRTSAAGLALLAMIILAAADGYTNVGWPIGWNWIAGRFRKWRNRFVEDHCDGLLDEPRPGRFAHAAALSAREVNIGLQLSGKVVKTVKSVNSC